MYARNVPMSWGILVSSQHTKWHEDVRLIEMLEQMRTRNKTLWSKCYFCDQKSQGIKSIDSRLYAVCSNHDGVSLN